MKEKILTGDRPTGKLHIGHYLGSLQNRAKLQDEYDEYVEIANVQALTDNFNAPEKVRENIEELLCDYYACGIDFDKATVFIQSEVPQIHEIFIYIANFATVQQLQHNPTIKTEMKQRGMEVSTPLGFFIYPIHQAADIFCVNASLVPVGRDQAPMIEDARILARKFNNTYKTDVLCEPKPLFGLEKNVPGIDGNEKMGKSLNNAIYLSDSSDELRKKVFKVYTDPGRIHATDPGKIDGNIAFTYLDLFDTDIAEVEDMKEKYRSGNIKDVEVKQRLFEVMDAALTPIREKRCEAQEKKKELFEKALEGSENVSEIAKEVVERMKEVMRLKF